MQNELISPNLHVVMIHVPLAFLMVGVAIEFFSFLWPKSSFRVAGRWMILLGALAAIPATFSGIYAFKAISQSNMDATWQDLKDASPVLKGTVWNMLRRHTWYQSIATGVAVLVVITWLGASDRVRRSLHVLMVLIMVGVVGAMIYGSWFGGEMIYRKGVAVQTTQPADDAAVPATQPLSWTDGPTKAEIAFPPIELHIIMAGVCTALAVLSIGLSFRRIHTSVSPDQDPIVTVNPSADSPRSSAASVELIRSFNPDLDMSLRPHVPAGRFWLLTFLVALITTLGGIFVIARDADILKDISQNPRQSTNLIWNQIKPGDAAPKNYRHLAHAISGAAIVALPIVLALLVRFAPGEKIILSITTFLLVVAVGAQIWLGILLWLDTSNGPLTKFNPPSAAVQSS